MRTLPAPLNSPLPPAHQRSSSLARLGLALTLCWALAACEGPGSPGSADTETGADLDATADGGAVDSDADASAGPDSGGPDTLGPDGSVADSSGPDTVTPDTVTPDTITPDTVTPDTVTPDTVTPAQPLYPVAPCQLKGLNTTGVGLSFPRYAKRLRSTGVVRAKVLFADFADAPAKMTPQQVADILSPVSSAFFKAASYGAMDFKLDFHLKWLRMSKPSADYAAAIKTYAGHRDWLKEAVALADPAVDFSDGDVVVLMAAPAATKIGYGPTWLGVGGPTGSLAADGAEITNGVTSGKDLLHWGGTWLNHELGHSLGLPDLYELGGSGGFTRPFSIMDLISGAAPGYFAYSRWLVGWLDDAQIVCLPKTQGGTPAQVTLAPLELAGGLKAAMVPVSGSRAVVIESRRALGLDKALTQEGAVVYTVDAAVKTGAGPIHVAHNRKALLPGESVTVDGVTVKVLSGGAAGDTVAVTAP